MVHAFRKQGGKGYRITNCITLNLNQMNKQNQLQTGGYGMCRLTTRTKQSTTTSNEGGTTLCKLMIIL